ncbi:MAG: DUF1348 family protein [Bacteroidota bacterium]
MNEKEIPLPPFTIETATERVRLSVIAWNTKKTGDVCKMCTSDIEWHDRTEFIRGLEEVDRFLKSKWEKELDCRLKLELWGFRNNRMAVRSACEWCDAAGQWYRTYGNELWEFESNGLLKKRFATANDMLIMESECEIL